MAGGDRLSALPNDLLRRVLHFAPAREGASTGALSKRWRGLWRSSGAVNLEERIPEVLNPGLNPGDLDSRRDAFVSAARSALAAAGSPVARLTLRVGGGHGLTRFLYTDVVSELLSLLEARGVEKLLLAPADGGNVMSSIDRKRETTSYLESASCFRELSILCLLSETLRVLDLTSCGGLQPSPGVAFPQLASLRLNHCNLMIDHLQDFINAAPALATVHLESVRLWGRSPSPEQGVIARLHFPGVTEILMDRCGWPNEQHLNAGTTAVEIDAPRLRRFTYKGLLRQLSLRSQAPDLARVHLHIFPDVHHRGKDANRDFVTFRRFAQNFSNAKELKLRVNMLVNIAVVGTESRSELLCSFRNLERLELEGKLGLEEETAVTIANVLHCCPVLRDLRINLRTASNSLSRNARQGRCYLEKKYRQDLRNSIHAFKNRRSEPMASIERDDDDDAAAAYDKLPELSALSGHVFHCLQSSLSYVRLQFRQETNILNTFAVKLIKFFAQNGSVLKEMHIDAGNGKVCGNINCRVEKWVANSSKKRNMSFVILPLER